VRVFVDSTVLVLSAGGADPDRAPARVIVQAAIDGRVDMHASVEAIQEFVHHRMRRTAPSAVEESRMLRDLCFLHPFDDLVLGKALELVDTTTIRGRDAVHAATAMLAGFEEIISADQDFDDIPGLVRISPTDRSQG
jgi:predicted nucleic acid-binding protein